VNKLITDKSGELLAQVITVKHSINGVNFYTDPSRDVQVASMLHLKGHNVKNHKHNVTKREIYSTSEVLVINRGIIRCFIYDNNLTLVDTVDLSGGQILILYAGGHGFEVLEDIEIIEVKQGPYMNNQDKTHF
jgi:hypothetical protein